MMRVTRIESSPGVQTLRVEGRLTRQTSEELRMACEAVLAEQRSALLDLSGVQFVDGAGVALLQGLERRGVALGGCSGFVGELLRERPAAGTPASDDAALVARARAGDAEAFERLVREHGGRMLATARRLVRSDDEAHDVVQDAFLAAFRALDGFTGAARLSTWLHRIVVNAALMRLRTRRRRREESIEDILPRFDDAGGWAEPPSSWDAEAETRLERAEIRGRVRAAIDRLPENYRAVLVLRDIEDLDTDETAAALGVTENAVKTRLHRARQALRTLLARELAAA
jgi:RNA polymerase sigma-70 factor (ECF subfamily)